MKMTKYMAALCLPLLALTACETDREMATFDSTTATPATLSINGTAQDLYTLDASNASVNVFTIDWSKPDFGLQVPVTNVLQMDIDGKNFSNAQVLTTETDVKITSYAVIASNLNANIQTLLNAYGMETPTTPEEAVTLNFRLASFITGSASDSLFSEVLNVRVLPYEGEAIYPSLDVVGIDGNWDFATSQKIYSLESNDTYSGMVYFNSLPDGGWKLAASSWDSDKNWGGDVEAEASTATLTAGGGNITAYSHKSYNVTFNRSTLVLEMSQARDYWGVIGINNKWGTSDDIDLAFGQETDASGQTQYYLSATVEVQASTDGSTHDTFKIRPDHDWDGEINADNISYEGDVAKDGSSNNFKLTEGTGQYEIKWYFNKAEQKVTVTKQ